MYTVKGNGINHKFSTYREALREKMYHVSLGRDVEIINPDEDNASYETFLYLFEKGLI